MALNLAARIHAFVHGLFRSSDRTETSALHSAVVRRFKQHRVYSEDQRITWIDSLADDVAAALNIDDTHSRFPAMRWLVGRLLDYESVFVLPDIDWNQKRSVSQWWELREALNVQMQLVADFDKTTELLWAGLVALVGPVVTAIPASARENANGDSISVRTDLLHVLESPADVLQNIISAMGIEDIEEHQLFTRLRDQFERNLIVASGGNLSDPETFKRAIVTPKKSPIKDPVELAETYLTATPLIDYLHQHLDFTIPQAARYEHMHIVAGSGHGKTQTLQYLICNDLPAVERGERSIVVIDSQGDLISNLAHLAEFAPGGPLHDRLVLIDPSDVEYPVSLNLFDVGIERLQGYEALERERLTNSILELYDFVLGSLLSAEMTQKQSVIFRYVTRLMLYIPDATIHTLRELMEPNSHLKFAEDIEKLSGTARHFFATEFKDKEFSQTRKQVLRRLWGILENQTFERMFSHPRSKLDLYEEMNAGKVILINTAKDLLKEQGTQIFGRFFIAMIAQAAQERATLNASERMPTFVYIDEAADYFDRNIGIILSQARKYNVGMVLAHQYLGQLDPKLQEAFAANTAIKLAGGVSAKDARALASMLRCTPELIESQPKGAFATSVRGHAKSAVPLSFPFGHLEQKAQMNEEQWSVLRDRMRAEYAVPHTDLMTDDPTSEVEDEAVPANESAANAAPRTDPDASVSTKPGKEW